jgi:hypothetical protein
VNASLRFQKHFSSIIDCIFVHSYIPRVAGVKASQPILLCPGFTYMSSYQSPVPKQKAAHPQHCLISSCTSHLSSHTEAPHTAPVMVLLPFQQRHEQGRVKLFPSCRCCVCLPAANIPNTQHTRLEIVSAVLLRSPICATLNTSVSPHTRLHTDLDLSASPCPCVTV